MKNLCITITLIFLTLIGSAEAGLKIYYMRHAEGGHNVKKDWEKKNIPEAEWPEYVGNPNMFTPKGLEQLVTGTEKLKNLKFDFIATSPMWRARSTVLPYLKDQKLTAEIWPELHEGPGSATVLKADLPVITAKILGQGKPIELSEEEAPYFKFIENGKNNFRAPKEPNDEEHKAAALKFVLNTAIERIKKRFGNSDKTILLVGHGGSGRALTRLLTQSNYVGKVGRGPDNTGLWMAEQQEDGTFVIKMYNDVMIPPNPELAK